MLDGTNISGHYTLSHAKLFNYYNHFLKYCHVFVTLFQYLIFPTVYNVNTSTSLGSFLNGNCIFKEQTFAWEKDGCNERHHFLCVDEEPVLVQEQKTWEQALVHCRKELVTGNTAEETQYDLASLPEEKYILLDDEKVKAITEEV